ncbi:hypothetical protein FB451DRAFT_1564001 [Mycena latifolia]|nr:hypothetical protein FB451DRAFT_1473872 [Mycena latifolia]KAJ7458132.1 hypothetical protein FB451DRAFT_1564001 [Mycena latifolia]
MPRYRKRRRGFHHCARVPDAIENITRPSIRRVSRRGGVRRARSTIHWDVCGLLRTYVERVIQDAVLYTEHESRSTMMAQDVVHALGRNGMKLYGVGV